MPSMLNPELCVMYGGTEQKFLRDFEATSSPSTKK